MATIAIARPINLSAQPGMPAPPAPSLGFLLIISLVVTSTIATAIYASVLKVLEHSFGTVRPQALCDRCQYFNDSVYLQCAVHPGKAPIERVADCPDFYPHSAAK